MELRQKDAKQLERKPNRGKGWYKEVLAPRSVTTVVAIPFTRMQLRVFHAGYRISGIPVYNTWGELCYVLSASSPTLIGAIRNALNFWRDTTLEVKSQEEDEIDGDD